MLLGAHVSIAGGLANAPMDGKELGCEAIQIFTKNQRQWASKPLSPADIASYRAALDGSGVKSVVVHDSYLIQLSSPDAGKLLRSREAFADELRRADALGCDALIFHPGAHLGQGEERALRLNAESIVWALSKCPGTGTRLLIETTAGQGTVVGYTLRHVARILELAGEPERVGVCIDIQHMYAAGYDTTTPAAYRRTMDELERAVGLRRVGAVHLNDSMKPLGSRVDRHQNIGDGVMGLDGFRLLVNDERFRDVPMVLETPGGYEGFRRDLKLLRSLVRR